VSKKPAASRIRAVASDQAGVGNHRYQLYAIAWRRVHDACKAGYHLEAITLLESLLSDRMESRARHLTGANQGFRPLGQLVQIFKTNEREPLFLDLVGRIDIWRSKRNRALHELVKFESGTLPSWDKQTAVLPAIVSEGQALLQEFAHLDELDRAKVGKRPATSPNVFRAPAQTPADSSAMARRTDERRN